MKCLWPDYAAGVYKDVLSWNIVPKLGIFSCLLRWIWKYKSFVPLKVYYSLNDIYTLKIA